MPWSRFHRSLSHWYFQSIGDWRVLPNITPPPKIDDFPPENCLMTKYCWNYFRGRRWQLLAALQVFFLLTLRWHPSRNFLPVVQQSIFPCPALPVQKIGTDLSPSSKPKEFFKTIYYFAQFKGSNRIVFRTNSPFCTFFQEASESHV